MARETYTLEEQPTYQEAVEKLLDSDPVKAEGSFLETLLLRILNNIKGGLPKGRTGGKWNWYSAEFIRCAHQ